VELFENWNLIIVWNLEIGDWSLLKKPSRQGGGFFS
jgi:hypothetical protein